MSTLKRTFLIVGVALFVMLDLILIINIGLAAANLDIASTGNSTSTLALRASATADNAGSESSGQDTSSNSADTIEADSTNQDSASQENADQSTSSNSNDNASSDSGSITTSAVLPQTNGSVVASAHDDSIDIAIFNVAGTGTANVLRFEANRYLEADPLKGVVGKASDGDVIGTYQCGSTQVIKTPRRSDAGHDYLYCKYYVEQNGKILAGPVYVTNIDASNAQITTPTQTKKGGANTHNMTTVKTPDIINDLDAKWTNVTVDLGSLLIKNENIDGSAIDQSIYDDTTTFTYEGVDYHFNNKRLNKYDEIIKKYTSYGINVQMILLCYKTAGDWKTYPQALSYVGEEGFPSTGTFWSGESIGYNTSTQLGEKYFLATMEFFAQRYSQNAENGLVHNYVIGNEIDWAFAWQHIASWHYDEAGKVVYETWSLDAYMEEIARSMRLANLALKKYNSNITVSVSFTNQWAESYNKTCKMTEYDYGYDTYAPKDQLDWLCIHEKTRGNYNWGLTLHPYGYDGFEGSDVLNQELEGMEKGIINADYKTSTHITTANLEIVQTYLENSVTKCNGQLRDVRLTEFSISAAGGSQQEQNEQAGYLAWSFYRCALLPCIKSFEYWPVVNPKLAEGSNSRTGLLDTDGQTKRKAYELWKYIDTNKSFEYASKYLPYLSYTKDGVKYCLDNGNISSYKDFLNIDSGNYDWDSVWNNWSITPMRADMQGVLTMCAGVVLTIICCVKMANTLPCCQTTCTSSAQVIWRHAECQMSTS